MHRQIKNYTSIFHKKKKELSILISGWLKVVIIQYMQYCMQVM